MSGLVHIGVMKERRVARYVAIAIPILTYCIMNFVKLSGVSSYVVPAALWLVVFALLAKIVWKEKGLTSKLMSVIPALITLKVVSDMLLGLAFGFGRNPQQGSLLGALVGISYSIAVALGTESLRTFLASMAHRRPKYRAVMLVCIAAAFTLMNISAGRILNVVSEGTLPSFLLRRLVPALLTNVFLTQLALWGGVKPLLTYVVSVTLYTYLTPALPALPWYAKPLATSLLPLMLIAVASILMGRSARESRKVRVKDYVWSVTAISLAVSMLLLLHLGYKPLVVISGSMEPAIRIGDVVVTAPLHNSYPRLGDVIAYPFNGKIVLHRVIGFGKGATIITKGDANNAPDPEPVDVRKVLGVMVLKIPLVGAPMIYLSKYLGGFLNLTMFLLLITFMLYFPSLVKYVGGNREE